MPPSLDQIKCERDFALSELRKLQTHVDTLFAQGLPREAAVFTALETAGERDMGLLAPPDYDPQSEPVTVDVGDLVWAYSYWYEQWLPGCVRSFEENSRRRIAIVQVHHGDTSRSEHHESMLTLRRRRLE